MAKFRPSTSTVSLLISQLLAVTNKTDSSSACEEGSLMTGSSLYILPYPWLVNYRPYSFNINDKPKESWEFFLEKVKSETPNNNGFPPDGGGGQKKTPVSCDALIEHDDTNTLLTQHLKTCTVGDNDEILGEFTKLQMCGQAAAAAAAATEARKRRLKNHFH